MRTVSDKCAVILEKFMPDLKLFYVKYVCKMRGDTRKIHARFEIILHKNTAICKHGGTMKWNDFRKWYRDNANN